VPGVYLLPKSTMSTFDPTASIAQVEPLKMLKADGRPYERPAHVQTELGRILALPHSERTAEVPHLHGESLVYLIRHRKQADEELYEVVFQELSKRIVRTARRHVRGFPKIAIEEIVSKVEMQILVLLVANSLDPAGDFFEVGFAQGVEGRTRNARRGYQRSLMGGRRGWVVTDETDEDGDQIERTIELVEDNAAGPEDIVLAMKDEEHRRELFEQRLEGLRAEVRPSQIVFHLEAGGPVLREVLTAQKKGDLARDIFHRELVFMLGDEVIGAHAE